jgi:hypothetical protein
MNQMIKSTHTPLLIISSSPSKMSTAPAEARRVVGWGIQQNQRPHLSVRRCVDKHQHAKRAPFACRISMTSTTPTTSLPVHPTTWLSRPYGHMGRPKSQARRTVVQRYKSNRDNSGAIAKLIFFPSQNRLSIVCYYVVISSPSMHRHWFSVSLIMTD